MKYKAVAFIFSIYLLLLLKFAVFKDVRFLINSRHFQNYNYAFLVESFQRANLIPLKTIYYYVSKQEKYETGALNLLGNIILFIPAGLLAPLFNSQLNNRRIILCFIILSFTLELMQLLINYGNFDIDDILLNSIGGFLGVKLYKALNKMKK